MRWFIALVVLALQPHVVADELAQGTVIVLNKSGNDASFVDAASGETWLTLPTGIGPHEVAVSRDGDLAVVANYGAGVPGNSLTVFDLVAREVVRTIDLGESTRPHGIQFLDDVRLVVTSETARAVLLVDARAGEVLRSVPTEADGSHMLVLAPDGKRAYTANMGSNSVSVLDLEEGIVLAEIETGPECEGIDITPDGKLVWTTNRRADTLSVIDTARLRVVDEVRCGKFPIRIKITPDGKRALVSNAESSEVAVIDVASRELVKRIPIALDVADDAGQRLFGEDMSASPMPIGVLISPDGRRAFIANTNADVVTILDLSTLELVGGFRTGTQPDGLGWAPIVRP